MHLAKYNQIAWLPGADFLTFPSNGYALLASGSRHLDHLQQDHAGT